MSATGVWILQTLFTGVFGAVIGSFLNVVVTRTHDAKPWISGRSHCPHCGRTLRWWELVPVGSFLLLGGKCKSCRHRLSVQYLLMECLTATMFMLVWLQFDWSWLTPLGWLVGMAMILIATYDGLWSLIPDEFSYFFIGASLLFAILSHRPWLDIGFGLLAGLGFFGLQFLISRGKWVGSGDIFLGLGLGALLGWRSFFTALILAYLTGALIAAVQIIRRKTSTGSMIAFGPYLMAAGFAAWLYGPAIVNWYLLYVIRF